MDSNSQSPPLGDSDTKNVFRKPSGEAANRNYRRRSPIDGSSSPDGLNLLNSWPSYFYGATVIVTNDYNV